MAHRDYVPSQRTSSLPCSSAPARADGRRRFSLLTLPIEFLHQRPSYDPATGELRWKPAPALGNSWNTRYAGKPVGGLNQGYVRFALMHGGRTRHFMAHRVVFAMTHGRWPEVEIDHKNGVRSNNRVANLREATDAQNSQNAKLPPSNSTGHTGVARQGRRWRAQIRVNGERKHIYGFTSAEDAGRAYLAAKQQLHPFYARQEA
jgi:hypothetical protein